MRKDSKFRPVLKPSQSLWDRLSQKMTLDGTIRKHQGAEIKETI
jgi:hypothetical protein